MPSSALGTMVRIRRNVSNIGNLILRADEGIGHYISVAKLFVNSNLAYYR